MNLTVALLVFLQIWGEIYAFTYEYLATDDALDAFPFNCFSGSYEYKYVWMNDSSSWYLSPSTSSYWSWNSSVTESGIWYYTTDNGTTVDFLNVRAQDQKHLNGVLVVQMVQDQISKYYQLTAVFMDITVHKE